MKPGEIETTEVAQTALITQHKKKKRVLIWVLIATVAISIILAAALLMITVLQNTVSKVSPQLSALEISQLEQDEMFAELALSQDDVRVYPNMVHAGQIAFTPEDVWVANGHGLLRYDKFTGEGIGYTIADGLYSTSTADVEYFDNAMWVATFDSGNNNKASIGRLDLKTEKWSSEFASKYNLGRLVNAEFEVGDDNKLRLYSSSEDKSSDSAQVAVYDSESKSWELQNDLMNWPKREVTEAAWKRKKATLGVGAMYDVVNLEEVYCQHEWFAGVRAGQQSRWPSYGGIAVEDDKLWYGCAQGFIVVDTKKDEATFKSALGDYPALIYDYLAAKDGAFVVHSNLGLGIVRPETKQWTKIRDHRESYNFSDFDWWNSAAWIGDSVYFVEAEFEDPSIVMSNRKVSMFLYDTKTQELRDVTPQPQQALQDAYYRIPYILRPTADNSAVLFQSGKYIVKLQPSVKDGIIYDLNPGNQLAEDEASNFMGFAESKGVVWYLTESFLGKVDSDGKLTKIPMPEIYDGSMKHVIDVNDRYVVVSGGVDGDVEAFVYDIKNGTWSDDLLVDELAYGISTGHDRLLVNEGRFKDVLITGILSQGLTDIDDESDNGTQPLRFKPGALVAVSAVDSSVTQLNNYVRLAANDISHVFYDGSAVCIRHGFVGISCIDN